jgi:hypothetical protein
MVTALSGAALVLVSGYLLGTLVLGPAMLGVPDGPAYWSEVVGRVRRYDGGRVTVPTILGLALGVGFIVAGFRMVRRAASGA